MIEAKLYFENGIDVGGIVNDLQGLPEPIRPIYFAEDEGKINKANLLSDEARFRNFRRENQLGFFLYAKNKTLFNVSSRRVGNDKVTLDMADGLLSDLAVAFFKSLAHHKPVFGFAYDYQEPIPDANGSYVISHSEVSNEYDHRNCYYITIGKNHIESGIGLKLEKYIPGVYWYTLLSDELLNKHHVDLSSLSVEAISTETLGDGSMHLLKFFERPEDWKENAERLDNLCERVSGVFSRRSVEAAVAGITSYAEYDEAIDHWR